MDLHRARHGWLLAGGQLSAEHVWQRTRHGSIRMRATPDLADTCLRLALADRSHRGPHASRKAPLVGGNQSVRHGPRSRAKMFWLSAEWGSSVFGGGLIRGSSCARRPKLSAKRICRIYVLTDLIDGICQIAACRALDLGLSCLPGTSAACLARSPCKRPLRGQAPDRHAPASDSVDAIDPHMH